MSKRILFISLIVVSVTMFLVLVVFSSTPRKLQEPFSTSAPKTPLVQTIRVELDKMVGDEYKDKYEIIKVIEKQNLCAVFILPPYREFPTVILFKLDNGKYQRIIEGLTIGIIDARSNILDLHTTGKGVDFQIGETGHYVFESNDIQKIIRVGIAHNSPIVVHSDFIHMHALLGTQSFYTIDKTEFRKLATDYFGKEYWERYPTENCTMYDLPKLLKMNFEFGNDRYVVTGETDNSQRWSISFSDVDKSNEFLLNKTIEVN